MNNKLFLIIVTVLTLAAVTIWCFVVFAAEPEETESSQSTNSQAVGQQQTANESRYATLMGDAFDEAYITDMIAHNDGALNMAEQAGALTTKEQIRELSGVIIQRQGMELLKLHTWRKDWGYESPPSNGHLNHGGGGLEGLSGETYDKAFLREMIIHHEQAIEMSEFAATNAARQEVKDLASEIIGTQSAEIEQMKEWQKAWGY